MTKKITATSVEVSPSGDSADIQFAGTLVSIECRDDFETIITLTKENDDFPFPIKPHICVNTGLSPVWLENIAPDVWEAATRATTGWQEMVVAYLEIGTLPTMYI